MIEMSDAQNRINLIYHPELKSVNLGVAPQ